jgi:hypothetical protein
MKRLRGVDNVYIIYRLLTLFKTAPRTRRQVAEEIDVDVDWNQICVCVAFISHERLIEPFPYPQDRMYRITDQGLEFISILQRLVGADGEENSLLEKNWSH